MGKLYVRKVFLFSIILITVFFFHEESGDSNLKSIRKVAISNGRDRNFVIVTATTWSYRLFSVNMACSLKKRVPIIFVALDRRVFYWLRSLGYHSVLASDEIAHIEAKESAETFGTQEFNKVTQRKISAVRNIIKEGIDVLYVDGDIYWCDENGITEILEASRDADVVAQRSHVAHMPINSGLYYVKSSYKVQKFLEDLELKATGDADDQVFFNRFFCKKNEGKALHNGTKLIGCISKNGTHLKFLSRFRFPIGCTRLKGRKVHAIEENPALVEGMCVKKNFGAFHFSCVKAQNKVSEMDARKMWIVGKEGKCKI